MSRTQHNTIKALATMLPIWIVAACIPLLLSECNSNDYIATPRPTAYPRIALHDSSFTAVALPRISLQVSTSAIASLHEKENATWIDINYPNYNATIHATYTPVDNTTLNATLANRSERIALDLGDTTFENISINNPDGTSANIYATRNNMVTPLMFLATDHKSWILSGAVAFDGTSTINYDSVAPIVNTLQRDLIHTLQNLSQQ